MTAATDSTSFSRHPRRLGHAAAMSRALFYVFVGLMCLAVTSFAAYDASLYRNGDYTVSYYSTGPRLIVTIDFSPRQFTANRFLELMFDFFSRYDTAIKNISCLTVWDWCATNTPRITYDMYCADGSRHNDDPNYNYVFVELQLCGWDGTTTTSPVEFDFSEYSFTGQLSVQDFAGFYDASTKKPGSGESYLVNFASGVVTYAVFGFLIGIALLAFVVVVMCVWLCDNRQANRNKSIVDRAIRAVRLGHLATLAGRDVPQQGHQPCFGYQYSMYGDEQENGPDEQNSPYWANSPGADREGGMGNANGCDFSPRDGDGREMKDVEGLQSEAWSSPRSREQ
ncbi:hypothetical protein GH5_05143 [Leishmania sp. Ghana 2012 LV757]|uniref:hypothetical protein n=1 Tax=Leishmania sp. Ghana 2012 LV757 TaxID=2803181 RepID=UPI001B674BD2|nr:hypothetical protein GH5_05143 [Leishmania sp. Ghana 2012 LV757]